MATLAEYMHWLRSEGGRCQNGIQADDDIGMVPVIKLISPKGKHVLHHGNNQSETLSSMMVDYYDRRLEMISPFRSKLQS